MRAAGVLAGFAVITIALTYPQVLELTSHVGAHYDSLFGVWRIAWIAHQLRTDPRHLFDANIFYPEQNTLAYSDALMLPGLAAAPLIWAGVSPVLVYNLLVLLSFVSSGAAMYWLARTLGGSQTAGWLSGIVFAFHPYRFAHYSQIELLWTCWIPLAFWALHRTIATRRPLFGATLGLMVALQALCCLYYGVFLVTALVVLAAVLATSVRLREVLALAPAAAAAVGVAAALLIPYALPYAANATLVGVRTTQDLERWSPTLANYTVARSGHWLYRVDPAAFDQLEGVLFPGAVVLVVAAIGLLGRPGRSTIAYLILFLVALDLSLGVNGWLYPFLYDFVWPYKALRVPARLFVIVAASLAALTVAGVGRIEAWTAGSRAKRLILSSILAFAVLENLSHPLSLRPAINRAPRLYAWLSEQETSPIMEWPLPAADGLGLTQDPEVHVRVNVPLAAVGQRIQWPSP